MAENKHTTVSISSGSIVRVILFGILLFLLYYLRSLLLVLLTSVVLASFVNAAVEKIHKYFKYRTLVVVLIYLLTLGILTGFFYLVIPIFIEEISNLISLLIQYVPASQLHKLDGTAIGNATNAVSTLSKSGALTQIFSSTKNFFTAVSGGLFQSLSVAFGGIINFMLTMIISFYLSINRSGLEDFLRIITPDAKEDYIISLWQRIERKIALWVKGQLLLGLMVGVLIYFGLLILGIQYAVILALTAAFFELFPLGLILAVVPALAFAYVNGGFTSVLTVGVFYFVVQQFEAYFIQPLVVKRIVGVSPLVVILSVLIGAEVAGFWGLILAVPIAIGVLEFTGDIEKKKIFAKNAN